MPQEEPDVSNFSTSSEHKLPAINGAQALQDELQRARGISTNLSSLNQQLNPHQSLITSNGIRRGYVTEVFGPPGSGKSTMGMQLATNAIRHLDAANKVIWLATSSPLMRARLEDIAGLHDTTTSQEIPSSPPPIPLPPADLDHQFICRDVNSLPHLLVMLMHPTSLFPPPNTSLLIIDGLSNFLAEALPRRFQQQDAKPTLLQGQAAKRANSKRFQIIDNLAAALSRLATSRHIAIVILMSATTNLKPGHKAMLKPALSRQGWDIAINTRITLYRDLYPQQYRDKMTRAEKRIFRLAEVTRLNGQEVSRDAVPFVIERQGLRELDIFSSSIESARPPPPKHAPAVSFADALEIRTSQPSQPEYVPQLLPTASQLLRQEYADALLEGGPDLLQAVDDPGVTDAHNEAEPAQASKRKAIEIADSEDEDEELPPDPTPLPALPSTTSRTQARQAEAEQGPEKEEMLFDTLGY